VQGSQVHRRTRCSIALSLPRRRLRCPMSSHHPRAVPVSRVSGVLEERQLMGLCKDAIRFCKLDRRLVSTCTADEFRADVVVSNSNSKRTVLVGATATTNMSSDSHPGMCMRAQMLIRLTADRESASALRPRGTGYLRKIDILSKCG
jgi:hypothetical protein